MRLCNSPQIIITHVSPDNSRILWLIHHTFSGRQSVTAATVLAPAVFVQRNASFD